MSGEVGVRLNGDSSNYRSVLGDAAAYTGKTFEQIEHHLTGTRTVATAVGTALGLHFTEIANNVARFVIGFSEEQQKSLEGIVKAGEDALNILQQIYTLRNTTLENLKKEEEHYAELSKAQKEEEARLAKRQAQQKSAEDSASTIAGLWKLIYYYGGLQTSELKAQKEISDRNTAIEESLLKISQLKLAYEKEIGDTTHNQAAEVQKLAASWKAANDEQRSAAQDRYKYTEENFDLLVKTDKVRRGVNLPGEREEVELAKLKTDQAVLHSKIVDALQTPLKNRTAQEKDALSVLITQNENVGKQIKLKEDLIGKIHDQKEAEHAITAEQQAQLDILNQKNSNQNLLDNAKGTTFLFDGLSIAGSARTQDQIQTLSDAVLKKIISDNLSKISTLEAGKGHGASALAEAASGYLHRGEAEGVLQTEINRAQYTLGQRNALRGADYNSALAGFTGDLSQFDALFNSAQQTSDTLSTISTQLQNSGLFPPAGPVAPKKR